MEATEPLYCEKIAQEFVCNPDKLRLQILEYNTLDPIWLNSGLLQDSTRLPREDVAEQYGHGYMEVDFYHAFTNILYNRNITAWQIDDILDGDNNSSMSAPIPLNVIHLKNEFNLKIEHFLSDSVQIKTDIF